ncbi:MULTISPECIES: LCP family protein [unclassified Streptomyces]|uniref:LCP family protein n=1 Tax=unclassified Streptomyces TaxID=2593676 RepID=UPI002DDA0F5D|nr:LCP family protein [Streptomyces sp. NBC_01775]WSB78682.1 LCP family protein [Streptomyces sp. NBC_01775]WSS41897.1 LCP family protein [Streptomyces sp. NBC_01187]
MDGESTSTLYRAGRRGRAGRGKKRRRWGRVAALTLLVVVLLVAAALGATYLWAGSRLQETGALAGYSGRPAAGKGTNWLIVGSDTRSGLTGKEREELHVGGGGRRNTDTVMVLHHGEAGPYLVSIPRDSYVAVPGHGRGKVNSAYALGGPKLLSRTVEQAAGLRLDRYAEVDFLGFTHVVDALDGVRVCLGKPLRDKKAGADLRAGCQALNGKQALAFVRARYSDPEGDLGRVKRQRELLSALVREGTGASAVLDPFRLHSFLGAALDAVTVDHGSGVMSLTRMAWEVRGLTGGEGGTTTVPVKNAGLSVPGAGDVVAWDAREARELFNQLRRDVPITATTVK